MPYRAILFDVGGPLDLEFAWEIAVDSAIAAACSLEGIRLDQAAIEAASNRAVEAFASDAYAHMIVTLTGGDPATIGRVRQRVRTITGNLDLFQLRPEIDGLLRRLTERGQKLGIVANQPGAVLPRLERAGIAKFFTYTGITGTTGLHQARSAGLHGCGGGAGCRACRLHHGGRPHRQRHRPRQGARHGGDPVPQRPPPKRPESPAEAPDAIVTDVPELEAAIAALEH